VHPVHLKNTALAQYEIDKDFIEYHNAKWEDKAHQAEGRMMRILAQKKPYFFARGYIIDKDAGSKERKVMSGVLKALNPEYWERNKDILGEALEWKDVRIHLRQKNTAEEESAVENGDNEEDDQNVEDRGSQDDKQE